jgi:hypothetical protein
MPDIDHPSHLRPSAHQRIVSRPDLDLVDEEDERTDDDHTLVELKRKRGASTCQEGVSSPSGEIFPTPPKKPRVC